MHTVTDDSPSPKFCLGRFVECENFVCVCVWERLGVGGGGGGGEGERE